MTDTKQMKVEELREILRTKHNITEEEIESLGSKSGVAARLLELEAQLETINVLENEMSISDEDLENDEIFDNAEPVDDVAIVEETVGPTWHDKNWTEYVISQLDENELRDGHPTVDGLRRITEVLVGEILGVKSEVLQVPTPENEHRATVKVSVTVANVTSVYEIDGCADVWNRNTDAIYAKHPVATAESRAESRAYRRLLRLRNIISAEEVVKDDSAGFDPFDKIQDHQVNAIENMSKKLDIDVVKWLTSQDISVLSDVSRSKGQELIQALNGLRDTGAISDDIKGFNANWRN